MHRVLIACDKFKGSATALEVAEALRRGLLEARPDAEVVVLPIADGGEGTVDAALAAGVAVGAAGSAAPGPAQDAAGALLGTAAPAFEERRCTVTGPYGEICEARFALDPRTGAAVIEVAEACGLRLVDTAALRAGDLDATAATSAGVGELIVAALDAGARSIVLGLGGSATTDGGSGMLAALGLRITDAAGEPVGPGGAGAALATRIDAAGLDPRLSRTRILVASDVVNPLCGGDGAAAVYGPQKGVTPERIPEIDAGLARFGALIERELGAAPGEWTRRPGAGAAGGLGFAALAVLRGELRPGIDLVLDLLGFDAVVAGADLVITGEGRLDEQTLSGKAPAGVAVRAGGAPVVVVCGSSALPRERAVAAGFREVFELVSIEADAERCIREPLPLLEEIGRLIGASELTGVSERSLGSGPKHR